MARRGRWWIVGVSVIAVTGAAVAAWPAPEPPARFWVLWDRTGPKAGLHAAPGGPPIDGFEDWCVEGGCIEPRGVGPPESRAESFLAGLWSRLDQALYRRRRRFQAYSTPEDLVFPETGEAAGGDWIGFVRECDALPPDARPDPALVGTWDEKDDDGWPVTWRLDADGRCEGSHGGTARSGRWGVLDGVTFLLLDGSDACEARFPATSWILGRPAWRQIDRQFGMRR